ncbi:MAG: AAA family ATPase [Bacteroidota bacterium]
MNEQTFSYGRLIKPPQLIELLSFWGAQVESERIPDLLPICVWGEPGLGKTQIVESFARSRGWAFTYLAPAQFEEMGDLTGMPQIHVMGDGQQTTKLVPPAWVPREPGPGLLLIDDVNRADERILRGMMQLLQRKQLGDWSLPKGWIIALTANPDREDFSVTHMDSALLDRMLHVELQFDLSAWQDWAVQEGLDARGILFTRFYPHFFDLDIVTPRSFTQFLQVIKSIPTWQEKESLLFSIGGGLLGEQGVATFLEYLRLGLERLPTSDALLQAAQEGSLQAVLAPWQGVSHQSFPVLSRVMDQMRSYLKHQKIKSPAGLIAFLKWEGWPADLRLQILRALQEDRSPWLKAIQKDPTLNMILLDLI